MTLEDQEDIALTPEQQLAAFKKLEESLNYDEVEDRCVVKLERVFNFGSEEYTEVIVNPPTWEDLDTIKFRGKLAEFDMQVLRKLAARMSNLDEVRLKRIKGKDIKNIMNAVTYFLQKSLT